MALNTANVQSTEFSEGVLKETVKKVLSKQDVCEYYLTKTTDITDLKIKPEEINSNPILKSGSFNNENFINVVNMDISAHPDSDPETQTPIGEERKKIFYLHYSKPALGANQTRGECKNKQGNTDLRGCYYLSCEINYKCSTSDDCSDNKSDVTSCYVDKCLILDKTQMSAPDCGQDQVLKGTQSTDCVPIPGVVFKPDNLPTTKIYQEEGKDVLYHTALAGFSRNPDTEEIQPKIVKLSRQCPAGQYPVRKIISGEIAIECQIMCTGGSTLNTNTNPPRCECPDNKPKYKNGLCQKCPAGFDWDRNLSDCKCSNDKVLLDGECWPCTGGSTKRVNSNRCTCERLGVWAYNKNKIDKQECKCVDHRGLPRWERYFYNKAGYGWNCYRCRETEHFFSGLCITCQGGATWNGSNCVCSGGRHYVNMSSCQCPAGTNQHYYNNDRCITCPQGAHWENDRCVCTGSKATWNGTENRCDCPNDNPHYYLKDSAVWNCWPCPIGQHHYSGGCHPCPRHFHRYGGRCIQCPPGSSWQTNKCICSGGRTWDYIAGSKNECKCTGNKIFHNGQCKSCPSGSTPDTANNRCNCGSGKVWKSATNTCSCPTNRPHDYAGRCNKCPQNQVESRGHCCPSGTPNWYYGICIRCPSGSQWSHNRCVCTGQKNRWSYVANQTNMCDCPSGQHEYDNGCHRCPQNQHEYDNGCHRCPRGQHLYAGNCIKCPSGSSWQTNRCVCTGSNSRWNPQSNKCINIIITCNDNAQWDGSQCICQDSSKRYYRNRCRPKRCSGANWWMNSNGDCCRAGHFCLDPDGDPY